MFQCYHETHPVPVNVSCVWDPWEWSNSAVSPPNYVLTALCRTYSQTPPPAHLKTINQSCDWEATLHGVCINSRPCNVSNGCRWIRYMTSLQCYILERNTTITIVIILTLNSPFEHSSHASRLVSFGNTACHWATSLQDSPAKWRNKIWPRFHRKPVVAGRVEKPNSQWKYDVKDTVAWLNFEACVRFGNTTLRVTNRARTNE